MVGLWYAGCWLGSRVSPALSALPAAAWTAVPLLALAFRFPWRLRGTLAPVLLGVALAGSLAGAAALQPAPLLKLRDHDRGLRGPWRLRGVLDGDVEPVTTGSVAALTVTAVRVDGVWRPWTGRVLLRVQSPAPGWPGGTAVEGRVRLRDDRPPANPGSPPGPRLRLRGFDVGGRLHAWSQLRRLGTAPGRTAAVRSGLRASIRRLFPGHTPLVRALLLGERGDLPGELTDDLARAGLVHLIAVSGLHVGLLLGAFVLGARALGLPRPATAALGLASLALMAVVVAPRAPIRRALVMGGLLLGARISGRRSRPIDALAMSVLLPTLGDPAAAAALDLQLSAVATLGILALPMARPGLGLLGATLAAQAAVAPLLAARLGVVPVAGLALNLVATPLLAGGMVLASLAVLLDAGGLPPASLATVASGLLAGVVALAELGEAVPPVPVRVAGWLAALAWWLAMAAVLRARGSLRLLGGASLGLLAGLALGASPSPSPALVALDVGQGDALLIRHPAGDVLVDAGGYPGIDYDTGAAIVAPALRHLGVRRLEAVGATHPHADHIGGIPAVLERFPTGALWLGSVPVHHPGTHRLLETAARRGIPALATAGAPLPAPGCRWRSLNPGRRLLARGARRVDNDASLVLVAECGGRSLLLAGDAGLEAERAWVGDLVSNPLLKVGHHGSDTSTGTALLDALRPRHALISVGARNPFGLPREGVTERLRARGIAVYRTDRDGAVSMHLEGRVRVRGLRWRSGSGP